MLHNLLHTTSREAGIPASLKQPAITRMSGNVSPQSRGKGFSKENVAVLVALALVNPDLAAFQINVGHLDAAQLIDPHCREEEKSQEKSVLYILGVIDEFVEPLKIVGVQDTRKSPTFLRRSKLAFLADLLGNVSPAFIIQARSPHDPGDLCHNFGFRFFVLRCETGGVFVHFHAPNTGKQAVELRGPSVMRNRIRSLFAALQVQEDLPNHITTIQIDAAAGKKLSQCRFNRLSIRVESQFFQCVEQFHNLRAGVD